MKNNSKNPNINNLQKSLSHHLPKMTMSLKFIDKGYTKKINRLKKQSTKYKQRSMNLLYVAIQQESQIAKMNKTNDEIVQNFEENQTKIKLELVSCKKELVDSKKELTRYNDDLSKHSNSSEYIFIVLILLWIFTFVCLVHMVHSKNGLSKDDVDVIYGCMCFAGIIVFVSHYVISHAF
jgi:hypothetical protein